MLGGLVVGFVGAGLTMGACGEGGPGPVDACQASAEETPAEEPSTGCAEAMTEPCKRYYLPLLGNPTMNPELRAKYKAAFGSACYVAADGNSTFNCFYKEADVAGPKKDGKGQACQDAKKIGEVSGLALYDQDEKYTCAKDEATGDYWLQVGSDSANRIYIKLGDAPLETSLVDVDGVPTEINGPYRNLVEVTSVEPGKEFYCTSGQPGLDGGTLDQREWILQVNRNANGGKIRSDLAGFTYPCKKGCPQLCTEPEFLNEPPPPDVGVYDPNAARVHHVVRKKDLRSCDWGTNAYKNAAVISDKLNIQLKNYYPSANEINQINKVAPHSP
ncbi:hypothetical protein [Polyangium spumosum]|uniref:Uncharacterized protein n=1 Tax=Polyangium spumosum TaxID=889282 RepID=A0A6N7PRJ8_9BACT|nr:hypothetical protein [Polyangium spumosum]MRG91481.1 hypothetical protein [Polyangium spumosum]